MKPPPQLYALAAVLSWNYRRSTRNKSTISQFSRQFRAAFLILWAFLTAWIIPHIWRKP